MSDENIKNQDESPDQDPGAKLENSSESTSENSEDALLSEVDTFLSEQDPTFVEQIKQIRVATSDLDVGVMGQALGLTPSDPWRFFRPLIRPFEIRTNPKAVIIFWLFVGLCSGTGYLTWSYKGSVIPSKLFITSFAEIGTDVVTYDPGTENEPFYDNPRVAKNLITISPMRVNITPSENSSDNPMLAIEITVEGLSSDAIVEIKDREAEFKDKLISITAGKTYDEVVVAEGKQLLCEQFRDALNASLSRGQVRRVLLKTFVLKP